VVVDPSRVGVTGALAPFAGGFVVALEGEGRPPHGSVKQLQLFAHLSRWLEAERLGPADLDREVCSGGSSRFGGVPGIRSR